MNVLPKRIDLVKLEKPGSVGAEIGVWKGYFSVELLELPLKKLYLIDAWVKQECYNDPLSNDDHEANLAETRQNISGHMPGGRVEILRGLSTVVACEGKMLPLDWAYIDGDHSYAACLADLHAWSKRLKAGGVLLGHDYTLNASAQKWNFGVIPAVTDFCAKEGWKISHLTDEDFASYRLVKL